MATNINQSAATWNTAIGSKFVCLSRHRSVKEGSVSCDAEYGHFSMLVYEVPSWKVRHLLPGNFRLDERTRGGEDYTWVSVVSYLDSGSAGDATGRFERTDYNLHIIYEGKPATYLIETSLGSLSGVATRNLWPMNWSLSAMEFQASYDRSEGRYGRYRLSTQCESATAAWEIEDSGRRLDLKSLKNSLPSSIFASASETLFVRRDGKVGSYRSRYAGVSLTAGSVVEAQSDVLERLGLMSREEMGRPVIAALQPNLRCQVFTPALLEAETASPRAEERAGGWRGFAYAN